MEDLVSIIIPVYQVEKYLEKCLESVINQTYKKIEVILIDDGSKDNSGKICDEYAQKDKRIIVIHKNNEGVSKARNVGIECAKGTYITFVDSDDFIHKDYIEKLYELCKHNNADLSICGTKNILENEKVVKKSRKYKKNLDKEDGMKELLNEKYYTCVIWAKMYKKELFKNIRFNEKTKIAEDLEVLYKVLDKCKKISINTFENLYYYRIRDDSATVNKYNSDWENEINISEEIIKFVEKKYPNVVNYAIKRYVRINVTCISKVLKYDKNIEQAICLRKNIVKLGKKAYFKVDFIIRLKIFLIIKNIYILKNVYEMKNK